MNFNLDNIHMLIIINCLLRQHRLHLLLCINVIIQIYKKVLNVFPCIYHVILSQRHKNNFNNIFQYFQYNSISKKYFLFLVLQWNSKIFLNSNYNICKDMCLLINK